jgi:hypothetical protein
LIPWRLRHASNAVQPPTLNRQPVLHL